MIQRTFEFRPEPSKLARQQAAVLARLQQGPATSIDLNRICLRYAARIFELRRQGHDIVTSKAGGIATFTLKQGDAP